MFKLKNVFEKLRVYSLFIVQLVVKYKAYWVLYNFYSIHVYFYSEYILSMVYMHFLLRKPYYRTQVHLKLKLGL